MDLRLDVRYMWGERNVLMGCGRMIDCRSFKPSIPRLVFCVVEKQRHGQL